MEINQRKYDRDIGEAKKVREREFEHKDDEELDNTIRCSFEEFSDVRVNNPGRNIIIVSNKH